MPRSNADGGLAFAAWQLGHVDLAGVRVALDVGSGRGTMARALRAGINPAGLVVALDIDSAATAALRHLSGLDLATASIQRLPCPSGVFDLVVAGHVLYYAPTPEAWIRELRRVTHSRGVVLASTDSAMSGRRLLNLHAEACRRAGRTGMARRALAPTARDRFTLENGAPPLQRHFAAVRSHAQDRALVFPDVAAALQVYRSGLHTRGAEGLRSAADVQALADLLTPAMRPLLEAAAEPDGTIVIPRRHGFFLATSERPVDRTDGQAAP